MYRWPVSKIQNSNTKNRSELRNNSLTTFRLKFLIVFNLDLIFMKMLNIRNLDFRCWYRKFQTQTPNTIRNELRDINLISFRLRILVFSILRFLIFMILKSGLSEIWISDVDIENSKLKHQKLFETNLGTTVWQVSDSDFLISWFSILDLFLSKSVRFYSDLQIWTHRK